jgi:hypothetical protein
MLPTDVVMKTIDVLQSGDVETMGIYLASDFICRGMAREALDKSRFLKAMDALLNAIPNWSYNVTNIEEKDDLVLLKAHVRGKNTRPLNLYFLGIEPVPQKGIRVSLPEELIEYSVKENKITSMKILLNGYASSIDALLEQLGVGVRELVSA